MMSAADVDIIFPFHQIFLYSPAVWLIFDAEDGRIVEANHAAANFYGYSISELKSMSIFSINVRPVDRIREYMLEISQGTADAAEFQHLLKNKQLRDVTVYSAPFANGNKVLYSSVIIDVTVQKDAERRLQRSRDRLGIVVEGTGVGTWEWDIVTRELTVDSAWKKLVGYEEHELIEANGDWGQYCHPDDIIAIRCMVEEALREKRDEYCIECRTLRKNGTYFWVKSRARIIYDQELKPLSIVGSIMDITPHKEEIKLQREKGRVLHEFAQVIADKGFIFDEDGVYIEVFGDLQLLPMPREELLGKTLFDVLPLERASFFLKEIRQTISEGIVRRGKITLELPHGPRIFDARAALIDYKVGGKKAIAVVMTDITDQEQIRERLQASYEMRRRSDIFNDLLNGARQLDEDLMAYVNNLRLNFGSTLFCCSIYAVCKEECDINDKLQYIKDEIINNIHGIEGSIAWNCRGQIGVVCQTTNAVGRQISRRKLAEEFYAIVAREFPDITIHIGIGEIQRGLNGFQKSFQQAWDAAKAADQGLEFGKSIIYFRELGVLQLLLNQGGKERAADFTRLTLQKIIQYDCEKGTDYINTLEVILQSTNLKEAAETLFLHHNTAVFRKKRIEEILGKPLSDFETKLSLALAIKFYRMWGNEK